MLTGLSSVASEHVIYSSLLSLNNLATSGGVNSKSCQDPPNLQAGPPEKRLFADPPEAPKPKDKGKEKGKGKGSAIFFKLRLDQ